MRGSLDEEDLAAAIALFSFRGGDPDALKRIRFQYMIESFEAQELASSEEPRELNDEASNDPPHEVDPNSFSSRTLAQLEAWLKPPARPKKFPLDLVSGHAMKLSYYQVGSMPKVGLADKLVREMEERHALKVEGWGDEDEEERKS